MKAKAIIIFLCIVMSFCIEAFGQTYEEPYRLQYHFSPQENWINDPCGMVYLDGEYHLMYQYNPFGTQWGSMSWGHAVSKDLVYWEELPVALFPDSQGQIFSGGAVIDYHNTAGFGDSAMVAIYTSAGTTQKQSIAYSLDRGRSWKKYSGNPVLPNQGIPDFRDPQVFWHGETGKWVMTLAVLDRIDFYSSPNLKEWTFESSFGSGIGAHGGVWECPDLFKLKVEGQTDSLWVLMVSLNPGSPSGGSGTQYFVGNFDGTAFTLTEEFSALLNTDRPLPEGMLFEDFESTAYEGWTVVGDAFGSGPAQGNQPDQQPVSGYLGQQLVNSYLHGDGSQGKLSSPHFTLGHKYVNFLIGGGNHPGGAEIRLLVDGKKIAAATGRNAENLLWHAWDVENFIGATAQIEIVDSVTGGWGHINIDHIYFSNTNIVNEQPKAFWADYGPDFYAGRSWENQPEGSYQRVWLAWMNNWSYAGAIPTSGWRGSMSLPRSLELRLNEQGGVRLYQNPVNDLEKLRQEPVSFTNLSVAQLNQQLQAAEVAGSNYELSFTLLPATTSEKAGVELLRGSSGKTIVGYDPALNAVYLDRSQSGRSFSGDYDKVFYAPLAGPVHTDQQELKFRIFVDESAVEVFVNDGAVVQTARVFPQDGSEQLRFFGSEEVLITSFDFWKMASIWQQEPALSLDERELSASIIVFPNPAIGVFSIKSQAEIQEVSLYTQVGKRIPISLKRNFDQVLVNTAGAHLSGLNYLHIRLKNGSVVVKKILIQ